MSSSVFKYLSYFATFINHDLVTMYVLCMYGSKTQERLTASLKSSNERDFAAFAMAAMASSSIPACFIAILVDRRAPTSPAKEINVNTYSYHSPCDYYQKLPASFSTLQSTKYFRTLTAEAWFAWSYASNACRKTIA